MADQPDNHDFRNVPNDNAENRGYRRFLELDESLFPSRQPDYAVAMSEQLTSDPMNRPFPPSNPHPRVDPNEAWRYAGSRVWTGSEFVHATRSRPAAPGGPQGPLAAAPPPRGPPPPPSRGFPPQGPPPPSNGPIPQRLPPPGRSLPPQGPSVPRGRGSGAQGPSLSSRDSRRVPPQNSGPGSHGLPILTRDLGPDTHSPSPPPTGRSVPRKRPVALSALPPQNTDEWSDEAKMLLYKCKTIHKKGFASFVGRFPGHTVESLGAAWPKVKEEGKRLYEEREERDAEGKDED